MEIKAILKKPYTEKERISFIITANHNNGYEIRETEEALEAWGYTEEEKEEQEKQCRINEINNKIKELEQKSTYDILYNNSSNLKIYQDIIKGLEETRDSMI